MPELDKDAERGVSIMISDRSMAENKTGQWRSLRPIIDHAKCTGCLLCWKFCPEACVALPAEGTKAPTIDLSYCKGCAICAEECPQKCVALQPEVEA